MERYRMINPAHQFKEDVQTIVQKRIKSCKNDKSVDKLQKEITTYIDEFRDRFGYMFTPKVRCRLEGPFVTVNFLDSRENRIENYGDLVYYMDTGSLS